MVTVYYDGVDSGPLIAAAAVGNTTIVLAAGYHKIDTHALIPAGRTIIAYNATIEVTSAAAFWLQGATTFKGGVFLSPTFKTSSRNFAVSTLAGSATLYDVELQHGVRFAGANLINAAIYNCAFHTRGEYDDAIIENTDFIGGTYGSQDQRNCDTIIRGAVQMNNCRFHNCRLVSNTSGAVSGLTNATLNSLSWYFKENVQNEGEAFLVENANMINCTLENLHFYGVRRGFQFYNIPGDGSGNKSMTGNTFTRITCDTAEKFLWLTGDVGTTIAGNSFDRMFIKNVTCGIHLEACCGANAFSNTYIDNIVLNCKHDGVFYLEIDPADRTAIIDDGGTVSTYSTVNVSGLNGASATNKVLSGVTTS